MAVAIEHFPACTCEMMAGATAGRANLLRVFARHCSSHGKSVCLRDILAIQ